MVESTSVQDPDDNKTADDGPRYGTMHDGMSPKQREKSDHQGILDGIHDIVHLLTILIEKQWPTALIEHDTRQDEPTD